MIMPTSVKTAEWNEKFTLLFVAFGAARWKIIARRTTTEPPAAIFRKLT